MYQKYVASFVRCALTGALAVILTAPHACAQTMDGSIVGDEAFYGTALSTQNVETQFGDAFAGDQVVTGGGSEINQFFAKVSGGRLHVMVTGNLEENFNKMSFFFDTRSGGQNQLDGATLPTGVDGWCCSGGDPMGEGALQRQSGMKFDADFEADYFLTFSNGLENALSNPGIPQQALQFWAASAHYSDLTATAPADRQNVAAGMQLAPNGLPNVLRFDHLNDPKTFADDPYGCATCVPSQAFDIFSGQTNPTHIGPQLPNLEQGELIDRDYVLDPTGGECVDDTGAGCLATELGFALDQSPTDPLNSLSHRNFQNRIDLRMALDNSNIDGLPNNTADSATTGLEFSIPLSEIGNPTGDFKVFGFVNGTGHDFASNQFVGDGIGTFNGGGNLGGDNMGGFTGTLGGVDLSVIDGNQYVTSSYSPPAVNGDFNNDGMWECSDIDALVAEVVMMGGNLDFDMNNDGSVDVADVEEWLVVGGAQNPGQTGGNAFLVGDATLDGVVDGLDFIEWNDNKFTEVAAWCSGDFNADGIVDGLDFIEWNDNKFMSSNDVAAVPEPTSGLLLLAAGLLLTRIRRR